MMFHDLADISYDNTFRRAVPDAASIALIWQGDAVLAYRDGSRLRLPSFAELPAAVRASSFRYAFTLGKTVYFVTDATDCAEMQGSESAGESLAWIPSREYRGMEAKEAVFAAAVGESLHRWYGATRFCGRCGQPMTDSETERARVCPACGLTVYPKICPAVIVAVTDGDRLLLTKYQGRSFKRFALVAGFHEIGETLEDTVRREVFEETGLRVKNLRYYKSQPWVFTDSLLMGFWCELDGSDALTIQKSELSEAGWYHRDAIPTDHSGISLTGEMMEVFRRGEA